MVPLPIDECEGEDEDAISSICCDVEDDEYVGECEGGEEEEEEDILLATERSLAATLDIALCP